MWQQGHQAEAAFSPSPRLRANAVPLNPSQAAATVPNKPRQEGWREREEEKDQRAVGYNIHGGGPLSYVIHITHTTSSAICQQGCNAAGVKHSQEANGA